MTIKVMLEAEITDAERTAVAEVFESAGMEVDLDAAYIRRGVGLFPGSSKSFSVWELEGLYGPHWAGLVMRRAGTAGKS